MPAGGQAAVPGGWRVRIIDNHSHSWPNSRAADPAASQAAHTVYVCICNGVTDHDIRKAADAGCKSLPELTMRTGAGANCGSCLEMAAQLLGQARTTRELSLPILQQAA